MGVDNRGEVRGGDHEDPPDSVVGLLWSIIRDKHRTDNFIRIVVPVILAIALLVAVAFFALGVAVEGMAHVSLRYLMPGGAVVMGWVTYASVGITRWVRCLRARRRASRLEAARETSAQTVRDPRDHGHGTRDGYPHDDSGGPGDGDAGGGRHRRRD